MHITLVASVVLVVNLIMIDDVATVIYDETPGNKDFACDSGGILHP